MKQNLLPWQLLTLLALLAPTLYLLYAWPQLPAQIPTHFGLDGRANDYTGRGNIWLLTSALPLGVAVLFTVLPRFDPKQRFSGEGLNFQKLRLLFVGLVSVLACYCLRMALQPGTASGRGVDILVGLFLAFMGNYLTTVQPNYFIGIRTPWTLESPAVWARTHRVGGVLFCISGLLLAGLALVLPVAWVHVALLVLVLGPAIFCYAYSYAVYRRLANATNAA